LEDSCVIDEFTSVVDRTVAKSCSVAVTRFIKQRQLSKIVFASCHYDIIPWLQPDWVFDTATNKTVVRGFERRPRIELEITPCGSEAWSMFSQHHYLDQKLNKAAHCWIALWEDKPVGFVSALAYPSGTTKNAWREHRTVVLPDYQGLGIGVRISDAVASLFIQNGKRYFSKTAHPRMGEYRNNSPFWKPTSKNMKTRPDYIKTGGTKEEAYKHLHSNRLCYSHEFIG
jgi:GNAT superfamily N-acetyltransferase